MNGSASCAEAAPLAAAAAREGGERPLPDNFPVGMRVLLVDDDVTCLAVVKRMLLSCKYEVTTCSQATKALSLLRENKSAFDIILSDVHMPDMDGFRLLELIGLDMDLPVIMMSADTRINIVMKGIKHGACDFLIKPVQIAELQNIWQHLVRRKYHDNREHEHSANVDGSDRGKQIDDSENGTEAVDGSDCSWMYQKKNTDIKEEEDSELDNTDPSSSKKPRLVWTVELHQQFVNAVHQLGIEKAVPKRILELMNIPGLTRENVASHLQKFRNYLKRLSGVVQHHEGLSKSLYGGSANAKAGHLGSTGFQTLAVTGQIPPETLASLQDQLLGRPHSLPVSANAIDHTILHQSFGQDNKSFSVEQGTSFGQPLLRGQGASFPLWSSNNHGLTVSTSHDTNILATMLKQQQSHPMLSESQRKVNVHPCRLFSPSPLSQSFHVQNGSAFSNQVSLISPSQRSSSFHVENSVHPINQNSVVVASQVSTSLQTGNSSRFLNQNSIMVPSQSLSSVSEGNNPVFLRQNMPSQPFTNFQTGINQFDGLNSMINSFQTSSPCQSKYNVAPVTHNPILSDNISIADYNQLSSEFNIVPSNVGQVLDEGFNNSALINSYSNLGSVSSIDGNSRQKIQSADENFSHPNASIYDVPNSCNVQTVNRISDNLSDENNVRSPIFVGNGNHLPRGFVVDETGTHSNDITNGNIHITDDAYLLNQDLSGLNGSFQHGPPATTSFK